MKIYLRIDADPDAEYLPCASFEIDDALISIHPNKVDFIAGELKPYIELCLKMASDGHPGDKES